MGYIYAFIRANLTILKINEKRLKKMLTRVEIDGILSLAAKRAGQGITARQKRSAAKLDIEN